MNDYYVVTLEHGDPLAGDEFHRLGALLIQESLERSRSIKGRTGDRSVIGDLEYAEVFSFGWVLPGHEHAVPEWAQARLPTEEYRQFAKVYFLNGVAYRMYRDSQVRFEVSRVIPEAGLPRGCQCNLRGPYFPKDQ